MAWMPFCVLALVPGAELQCIDVVLDRAADGVDDVFHARVAGTRSVHVDEATHVGVAAHVVDLLRRHRPHHEKRARKAKSIGPGAPPTDVLQP